MRKEYGKETTHRQLIRFSIFDQKGKSTKETASQLLFFFPYFMEVGKIWLLAKDYPPGN